MGGIRAITRWSAFGGNGPLFACVMAQSLMIGRVLIPPAAGVFSSYRAALLRRRVSSHQDAHRPARGFDPGEIEAVLDRLEADARARLRQDGFADAEIAVARSAMLHYQGQSFELEVPIPPGRWTGPRWKRRTGRSTSGPMAIAPARDEPVELVTLKVVGRAVPAMSRAALAARAELPEGVDIAEPVRRAYFGPAHGWLETRVLNRAELRTPRRGPCIVEEYDSTCVIPPGCTGTSGSPTATSRSRSGRTPAPEARRTHRDWRIAMTGQPDVSPPPHAGIGGARAVGRRGRCRASRSARRNRTGKTLTVAIPAGPTTLDPINAVTHDPLVITGTIFENLVEYDQEGVLKPQLAKALPEISADKLVYTFDLRDDVAFHNGQKMTAEDVKYSFDSMLDPKRGAARRGVFARIDKVEVDGPTRVRVHLKEPYAPWVYFLTKYMGIWPKDSREKLGDEHFKLHPAGVGTGPGMFEEWRPERVCQPEAQPELLAEGPAALGAAGRQDRAGGRDAGRLSHDRARPTSSARRRRAISRG